MVFLEVVLVEQTRTISDVTNTRATLVPASIDPLMIASINVSNAKCQAKHELQVMVVVDTKDTFSDGLWPWGFPNEHIK